LRFFCIGLTNGVGDPAGNVIVPATKSKKTAPEVMPVISVPAGNTVPAVIPPPVDS